MGGSQYRDKLAVQMAAGTEPDCGISDVFSLGRYADAGLCLDLMPACEANGIDVRANYRLKGVEIWANKLVGMPWVTFGNALYYNKTMFQEVGAPDPYADLGGSWSCDQFVDVCRMLTEGTGKHALNVDVSVLHHDCAGFIYGRCARLYDFINYSYTLNEPATVKANEWLVHDLYEPGYIIDPETRDATALAGMMDPFSGGAVAMQRMSAGNVGTTALYVGDSFEWDIAPYPTASGSPDENSSYVSCDPNFVSANTANMLGQYARSLGLTLAWHQHWGSIFEVQAPFHRLMELTDPGLVGFCPDVGQLALGDFDVVDTVRRYVDRVRYVHYKDVTCAGRPQGELWPGGPVVPSNDGAYGIDSRWRWVELGRGVVDFPAITEVLLGAGYDGWIVDDFDFTGYPARASAQACKDYINQALGIWGERDIRRGLAPTQS